MRIIPITPNNIIIGWERQESFIDSCAKTEQFKNPITKKKIAKVSIQPWSRHANLIEKDGDIWKAYSVFGEKKIMVGEYKCPFEKGDVLVQLEEWVLTKDGPKLKSQMVKEFISESYVVEYNKPFLCPENLYNYCKQFKVEKLISASIGWSEYLTSRDETGVWDLIGE